MDDQKLLLLQKETGCDLAFGKLILKFTGGDIDGAVRIIKSVDKNIFIIRGKFVAQVERIYGTFLFLYDSKNRTIEKFNTVIKKDDKSGIEFDFEKNWNNFMNDITNYSHKNITEVEMQNRFSNTIRSAKVIQFLDSKLSPKRDIDEKALILYLKDILLNITGDLNVVLKMKFEKSDAFEINKGTVQDTTFDFEKEAAAEEKKEKKAEPAEINQIIVLKVEFELSPLEGVRLSELNIGEKVNVKMIDESPIASYISNLLKGREIDRLRNETFLAELKDIKVMDDGGISITVEFGPGIYGRAYYGEDVKVKPVYTEEEKEVKTAIRENFLVKNIWIIGGIFVCIIIIVILLLITAGFNP
jgi:hypothetical protein